MINPVIALPRLLRPIFGSRNASLFLVVFTAVLGVLLIVRAEGATDDRSARAGPFGYLLLLVASWLASEAVALRVPPVGAPPVGAPPVGARAFTPWVGRVVFATRVLLVVDLVLFAIVVPLQGGGGFLVISLLLLSLFVSAIVAAIALLLLLRWALRPGPPPPPIIALVASAIIAALVTNAAIGAQPPTPGAASGSTSPIPSPTRASPTPTPTTVSAALRVSLGGKASGTVRSQPSGIDCKPTCDARFPLETRVTLNPTAPSGSMFAGWAQSCSGVRDCVVVMKSDSAVTAFFEAPAGIGFETSVCGSSASLTLKPDETGQFSVCFANTGTTSWARGTPNEVVLGACCPLGGAAPLSAWNARWPSDRVYAGMTTDLVAPGQNANAVFSVHAPKDALPGDYRFDGILILARTGAPISGGTFSVMVTVPRG